MKIGTALPMVAALVAVVVVALLAIFVVGDDADAPTAPDTTQTATASETDPLDPTPELGGNILELRPAHGGSIPQAQTAPANRNQPIGVCAQVSFEGLPDEDKLRWFQLLIDEETVTLDITWFVTGEEATEATLCYQPESLEPLAVGRHTATLGVIEPGNQAAEPVQVVTWSFEVTG